MKRGMGWPIAIAAILGTTVVANVWVLYIANRDPSFAIEKDYYQKALRWDDEVAQQARNTALGWRLSSTLTPLAADGATLTVQLTDSAGARVEGATVTVAALHNARAGTVLDATLAPAAGGAYAVRLPMHRSGEWELRFQAVRGDQRFTAVQRLDAVARPHG